MDTSEIYIKMCDCPEIQGEWDSQEGDYTFFRDHRQRPTTIVGVYDGSPWALLPRDVNYGWLPRQDQIQEMVGEKIFAGLVTFDNNDIGERISYLSGRFDNFVKYHGRKVIPTGKNTAKATYLFLSMEQLWLAFYMYEKHKKIWDGEKWIIETAR